MCGPTAYKYIGGLAIENEPCDCKAPFAETGIGPNGEVVTIIWAGVTDTFEEARTLVSIGDTSDMDDLNMVCTRCGKCAVGC